MAHRVKVNRKNQITIPAAVRRQLHIECGDHLLMQIREGHIILMPEPRDYSQYLRGLHREVWDGVEPQEYARREREDWALRYDDDTNGDLSLPL
jgi:AbrB family looped-hinge helix DNA binding protein